jgi:hemolysin activation/secretion protein
MQARLLDEPKSSLDKTVRLYDQFYNFDLVVDGNQYDIVYSFFLERSQSQNIAKNFSLILFRISSTTGENVLDLLEYLRKTNKLEVNALLAYYLNTARSKTTLYGVTNIPVPNEFVQRNILN